MTWSKISLRGLAACLAVSLLTPATLAEEGRFAAFAPLAGHSYLGTGQDPSGAEVVDLVRWESILGGAAIQATHGVNGGVYGGRTIIFADGENLIFHYFTTGGFHTQGDIATTDDGFVIIERVQGHDSITEVRSRIVFTADGYRTESSSIDRDGVEHAGGGFSYRLTEPGPVVIGGQPH